MKIPHTIENRYGKFNPRIFASTTPEKTWAAMDVDDMGFYSINLIGTHSWNRHMRLLLDKELGKS